MCITAALTVVVCINFIGNGESDDSRSDILSTWAVAIMTFAVTLIVSVTATAIITFIVTLIYVKKKIEKVYKPKSQSPQEALYEQIGSHHHTITKNEFELQQNPAYGLLRIVDANPFYTNSK